MFKLFTIYLIIINILGFVIMYIDKEKAKRHKYRISEATLFTIAFFFGSLGIYLGMNNFRHKTKHKLFTIGIPILLFIQGTIIIQLILR